ncbi:sugar-binding transcriptional regulator [Phycicoccus flavus]|uniref:Sugar-binding protein n=1 Tax=Phycicoccus flavus TaxID=2502783 RepID=A0A8T6R3Y7_9MICO|nr:sugar-binding domain-containing protein [Phycicoccus flavus]NHA68604.1 sugar-binding protein [Phycicoccus flavus]NHA68697.1 sugar-binding protein [Phycicoccus flavus]
MYYLEDASQDDIARTVGYSRPTVSRMLTEARQSGMVHISISEPAAGSMDEERRLREVYGLEVALVAAVEPRTQPAEAVARLASLAVAERGNERSMIALSNGTSLRAFVHAMPRQRWSYSGVIQMVGSIGSGDPLLADSPELCRSLAARLGGTFRPLPVPLVLGSTEVARSMRQEEVVLTSLELAARSDIALLGVGAIDHRGHPGPILGPFMGSAQTNELRRVGAVAHLCGHFFDAKGRHLRTSLCERTMAMEPERLAGIGLVMAMAWGTDKVPAIAAILKAGLITGLATDQSTARLLLDYA